MQLPLGVARHRRRLVGAEVAYFCRRRCARSASPEGGRGSATFCYSPKFAPFLETVVKLRAALPVLLATLALCGCLGNTGSPQSPPTSVRAYGGDAMISVTWSGSAANSYWMFYAQDPTLSTNNWVNGLLNAGIAINPSSPWLLCNQVNNPNPTTQFPAMYFTMDGRTGTAPGGAGSPVVSGVARPAGGPYPGSGAPWTPGGGIGVTSGSLYGLGYVPVTTCGSTGAGGFPPAARSPGLSMPWSTQFLTRWRRGSFISSRMRLSTSMSPPETASSASFPCACKRSLTVLGRISKSVEKGVIEIRFVSSRRPSTIAPIVR